MFAAVMLPNSLATSLSKLDRRPSRPSFLPAIVPRPVFPPRPDVYEFRSCTLAELLVSPGRFRVIARRYPDKPFGTRASLPAIADRVLPESWRCRDLESGPESDRSPPD